MPKHDLLTEGFGLAAAAQEMKGKGNVMTYLLMLGS